ncbi:hypothetical protein V8C44DRAFT_335780 [Trichoderma aethiopicum]
MPDTAWSMRSKHQHLSSPPDEPRVNVRLREPATPSFSPTIPILTSFDVRIWILSSLSHSLPSSFPLLPPNGQEQLLVCLSVCVALLGTSSAFWKFALTTICLRLSRKRAGLCFSRRESRGQESHQQSAKVKADEQPMAHGLKATRLCVTLHLYSCETANSSRAETQISIFGRPMPLVPPSVDSSSLLEAEPQRSQDVSQLYAKGFPGWKWNPPA